VTIDLPGEPNRFPRERGGKYDEPVKVVIFLLCHSGLDPESSVFNSFWIPAFAGMTVWGNFYECGKYQREGGEPGADRTISE